MLWIEVNIEHLLFASRWLMAPFYVGLAVSLAVLLLKFCQELMHFLPNLLDMKETDLILWILTLIDLSLAGNLLLIVIFSGFENFVSKMDVGEHEDKPAWMGKVDFGGLKLKLVASIVAISAIQLLKTFMNIHAADERQTFWQVVVHLTFVVSGVLLATETYADHAHQQVSADHARQTEALAQRQSPLRIPVHDFSPCDKVGQSHSGRWG